MKNKDRCVHNPRSDFHMTQRTLAPVRFSDGLTGMVIASSGEERRRPSLQESVRSLLRQLAPPFYPPIPGRGPELDRLVDAGKSVLVVEHDLAVMAHRQYKGPVASLSSSSI